MRQPSRIRMTKEWAAAEAARKAAGPVKKRAKKVAKKMSDSTKKS